jgi:hypothetical protein
MRPSGMLNAHPKDMDPSPADPSLTISEYGAVLSPGVASRIGDDRIPVLSQKLGMPF